VWWSASRLESWLRATRHSCLAGISVFSSLEPRACIRAYSTTNGRDDGTRVGRRTLSELFLHGALDRGLLLVVDQRGNVCCKVAHLGDKHPSIHGLHVFQCRGCIWQRDGTVDHSRVGADVTSYIDAQERFIGSRSNLVAPTSLRSRSAEGMAFSKFSVRLFKHLDVFSRRPFAPSR